VERIHGPSQRLVMEMLGGNAWGNEPLGRFVLEKHRDQGELVMDKAQAVEDHRFDRITAGHNTLLRVLGCGAVNHLAEAQFFKHPGNEAEMIQDLTAIWLVHRVLLWVGGCT